MEKPDLQFRLATMDDAAQLQQQVQSAFQAEDSRPLWTADMALGKSFRLDIEDVITQMTKLNGGILIATDEKGDCVASVEVTKRADGMGRVSMLAVVTSHQCNGVGGRVLAYAEEYCRRTWEVKKVGLNALSTREKLISWYERKGYRKTGERTPFPYHQLGELELPDGLNFVELEKELE